MRIITKDIDYAIRAMMVMLKMRSTKTVWNVPELVKVTNISQPFLRKIMQILARKGIIVTHKGRKGGFSLKNKKASLFDVVASFTETMKVHDHMFKGEKCRKYSTCKVRKKLDIIEKYLQKTFKDMILVDLL